MNIASITVYCNEEFRLNNWINYYKEYKSEIYKHIVINNGIKEDTIKLQKFFPDSIVLFSPNKALTNAYNVGLRLILNEKEIDAIMLIGNDVKFPKGNVTKLYNFLNSNEKFGMVAPIIMKKDSEEVECCKLGIEKKPLKFNIYNDLATINILDDGTIQSDTVSGGLNMSRRKFYETVGLQDEKLFMYADEIDMGLR
ncbi:MAG: hypothetical protein PHR66_15055, partial [Desulfuromonadaceae bacterium]|nr:hypothetical protein [Desulfuromonadaceae bacterium]